MVVVDGQKAQRKASRCRVALAPTASPARSSWANGVQLYTPCRVHPWPFEPSASQAQTKTSVAKATKPASPARPCHGRELAHDRLLRPMGSAPPTRGPGVDGLDSRPLRSTGPDVQSLHLHSPRCPFVSSLFVAHAVIPLPCRFLRRRTRSISSRNASLSRDPCHAWSTPKRSRMLLIVSRATLRRVMSSIFRTRQLFGKER